MIDRTSNSTRGRESGLIVLAVLVALLLVGPPPGAAQVTNVRFVQGNYAVPRPAASSVSVSFPTSQTAGNLNVVIVGWKDTKSSITSVTDATGNTYARAVGPTVRGKASQAIYFAKNISGATTNAITVSFDRTATSPDVRVLEYSG